VGEHASDHEITRKRDARGPRKDAGLARRVSSTLQESGIRAVLRAFLRDIWDNRTTTYYDVTFSAHGIKTAGAETPSVSLLQNGKNKCVTAEEPQSLHS